MAPFYLLLYENKYNNLRSPALIIAGCFASVALVLSLLLTYQHLRSYTRPSEQKWIVAVIFMVPVYAVESILSLWNPKISLACDILRYCYEAFALYSFGSYLIACLGGEQEAIELLEHESRKQIKEPLLEGNENTESQRSNCYNFVFHPSVLGKDLFTIIKFGLVQYMILKTVCALLAFILELCGMYGDGQFKWYYGYPYITVVLNFGQMRALYCLVQFYNVTHQRLEAIRPLSKFISFKAIVFATWWQGVAIVLLCYYGILPKEGKFQTGLQDFLICIEMAFAAIAHIFVFSAKPYHFITASEYGQITTQKTQAVTKIEESGEEKSALVEKSETEVKAPGTSVKESVQDIMVEGGQKDGFSCGVKLLEQVVEDVVLTINQAIEPVQEGMTRIQETFHHISVSGEATDEPGKKVEEHEEKITVESEA